MIYVLIFMALVALFVAVVWAIGVACQGQVQDHEESIRGYYEWEPKLIPFQQTETIGEVHEDDHKWMRFYTDPQPRDGKNDWEEME